MSEPILSVHNLGKTYWLYPTNAKRVLGCFLPPHRIPGAHPHKALEGLTFDLAPGEALGLIGKNGAGKSTALQLLTGIVKPTTGSFSMRGRVCALLELGSGFNPEFTGRDNIEISGSIYGLSPEQIKAEKEAIIEFSEIGDYIDQPVKFYSSGMFLRLAFAVALAGKPDLLIVDEALAVGDIFFRQKCYKRLYELREQGMAVLLVTHSMPDVTEFCDRGLLLEHGKQVFLGDSKQATLLYYASQKVVKTTQHFENSQQKNVVQQDDTTTPTEWLYNSNVLHPSQKLQVTNSCGNYIESILITNSDDVFCLNFYQGETIRIYTKYCLDQKINTPITGYVFWNAKGFAVHGKNILHEHIDLPSIVLPSTSIITITEVKLDLECGEYTLNIGLSHINFDLSNANKRIDGVDSAGERLVHMQNCCVINIINDPQNYPLTTTHHGIANLKSKQSIYFNLK